MALTNDQITAQNFKDFYGQIRPYLNGQVPTFANQFSRSDLYSTSEKIIGQWIDGKPLYQKTVDCGTAPTGIDDRKYINSGLTNEKVLNIYGIAYKSSDNKSMPIPYVVAGTELDNFKHQISVAYYGGTHQIEVGAGADKSDYNVYVTLQYTKTTDSAIKVGTGTDYSTEEQVIGTWIDGKPLYQKTIETQSPSEVNSMVNICSAPTNMDKLISLDGYLYLSNSVYPVNVYVNSTNMVVCWIREQNQYVGMRIGSDAFISAPVIFTLQYTKTTD